jgi:intracellular sulfur oxidation DsrE/DsrF family protein
MRQLGTTMGFNDSLWQRYPLGEHAASDPSARPAARRNPYWSPRPGTPAIYAARSLEALTKRGVLVLVCNVAATNVARGMAAATHADVDTVVADFRSNLVPGATLVPSGIFALIRAQNAGCAFMRAS